MYIHAYMQSSMQHIRLDDTFPGRPSTSLTVLDASQRGTCGGFPAGLGGRSHQCCSQTQWSQSCRAAPLGLSALHSQARVGQHVSGCLEAQPVGSMAWLLAGSAGAQHAACMLFTAAVPQATGDPERPPPEALVL